MKEKERETPGASQAATRQPTRRKQKKDIQNERSVSVSSLLALLENPKGKGAEFSY